MSWTASRRTQVERSRGIRSTRARFVLEGLEERTVLSVGAGASAAAEVAQVHNGHANHGNGRAVVLLNSHEHHMGKQLAVLLNQHEHRGGQQFAVAQSGNVQQGHARAAVLLNQHGHRGNQQFAVAHHAMANRAVLHHGHGNAHLRGRGLGHGAAAKAHSQMTITGLTINDIGLVSSSTSGDQLVANATLTGTIRHQAFSLPLAIPITVTPGSSGTTTAPGSVTTAAATPTQVLNLSVGPVNLSLLGLNLHLGSSCTIGATNDPINVKLTAIPTGSTYNGYAGGAVGSLLGGVANLLNGGTSLSGLGSQLSSLESGLTQALNGALAGLNSGNSAATGTTAQAPAGQHEILDLDLNPINLDVLGALVQTSSICLNVTAARGPGNLLGNLLG